VLGFAALSYARRNPPVFPVHGFVRNRRTCAALAAAYEISISTLAPRVGVIPRRLCDLIRDPKHAPRARRAFLELAIERERFAVLVS